MSNLNEMLKKMKVSRDNWGEGKKNLFDLAHAGGRATESLPKTTHAHKCEVCGAGFGIRVYYSNVSDTDVGFCSPEHVQVFRARTRIPAAPVPKPVLARRTSSIRVRKPVAIPLV